jgi:hypothetical protein
VYVSILLIRILTLARSRGLRVPESFS